MRIRTAGVSRFKFVISCGVWQCSRPFSIAWHSWIGCNQAGQNKCSMVAVSAVSEKLHLYKPRVHNYLEMLHQTAIMGPCLSPSRQAIASGQVAMFKYGKFSVYKRVGSVQVTKRLLTQFRCVLSKLQADGCRRDIL